MFGEHGRHRAPNRARRYLLAVLAIAIALVVTPYPAEIADQQPGAPNVFAAANTSAARADSAKALSAQRTAGQQSAVRSPAAQTEPAKPEQPAGEAGVNANCSLTVPADPLSAPGLATPYVLSGTQPGGACHEANADQSAFVEATIIDPATGALSIYRPLVIDRGTKPAAPSVVPRLPAGAVVGVWLGFNGDTLTLQGQGSGACVNGTPGSPFGQFAYCGAPAFFTAANAAIAKGRLAIPPLGTGKDGMTCPSVRDFIVVDHDLGGDNRLLDAFIDPALGCAPMTAPDITANRAPGTSLALDELQAAARQGKPVALAPPTGVAKTNLYRAGVNQPPLNVATETGRAFCRNLTTTGAARLEKDRRLFSQAKSPDPGVNLADFLTRRLQDSRRILNCPS